MGIIRSIFGNSEGPPRICQTKWYSRGSGINNRNDPNKKVHLLETFFPERVRELISCSCWLRLMRAYLHPWAGMSSAVDIMASNDSSMTQRCTYQHQHHQGHFSSFSSTLFIHTLVKIRPRRNNATNSGLSLFPRMCLCLIWEKTADNRIFNFHFVASEILLTHLQCCLPWAPLCCNCRNVAGLVFADPDWADSTSFRSRSQSVSERRVVWRLRQGRRESGAVYTEDLSDDTIHLTQSSAHKTNRIFLLGKNSSSLIGIYKKFIQ